VDKKQRNILIWVLAWAGLLVVVLYSPVGSPDLYFSANYNTVNQGIAITSAETGNKPSISSYSSASSNGGTVSLTPTDYSNKTGGSYSSSGGSAAQFNSGSGAYGSSSGFSKGNSGSSMGVSSMSTFSYASSKKSDGGASLEGGGVMSVNSDFTTSTAGTTVRQGAENGTMGATDPGDDPGGSPIPVGDGWIFLLVLVSAYTVWKKIRL
jgi:hypothetical protein